RSADSGAPPVRAPACASIPTSAMARGPEAVSNRDPPATDATTPARIRRPSPATSRPRTGGPRTVWVVPYSASQDCSAERAALASRTGAVRPAEPLRSTTARAPAEASPQDSGCERRSGPTDAARRGPAASAGARWATPSRKARSPAAPCAPSSSSAPSAAVGTNDAADRAPPPADAAAQSSASAITRTPPCRRRLRPASRGELRPGRLRRFGERFCPFARAPRHGSAHVAVAQHQRREERGERGTYRPAGVLRQEGPHRGRGGAEEVAVPHQGPDRAAEREREDVRDQEEQHAALARHGQDVLLLGHGFLRGREAKALPAPRQAWKCPEVGLAERERQARAG